MKILQSVLEENDCPSPKSEHCAKLRQKIEQCEGVAKTHACPVTVALDNDRGWNCREKP